MLASLPLLLLIALRVYGNLAPVLEGVNATFVDVCRQISNAVSPSSAVYYPGLGLSEYDKDIYHWSSSSSQLSTCTVEPGIAEDVSKILRILGKTRTPFGIKSGGHGSNPNFSSSPGVLIAMYRFNEVKYDHESQTAVIGTGLVFDDVYAALAPANVSVLGGRVTGLGVGGFVLGGGYSWKSNQYGLAVDTVTAFELVKPDGEVATVTEDSDAELFFGLKGGFNNFGIVTRITMKTFPQTTVWAGSLIYLSVSMPEVRKAVINFTSTNTDPKATIVVTYDCVVAVPVIVVLLYYDAPQPPKGLFEEFLDIPLYLRDVHERTLVDFIKSTPDNLTANFRGVFHTVPILEYSENVMSAIEEETQRWCTANVLATGPFVSFDVEPFLPSILSHSQAASAYPPTRDKAYSPLNIYFGWLLEGFDEQVFNNIRETESRIRKAVLDDGQAIDSAPLYPNYALFDTPLERMYGQNVERMKALRKRVDPFNVMGLAGGFRFDISQD